MWAIASSQNASLIDRLAFPHSHFTQRSATVPVSPTATSCSRLWQVVGPRCAYCRHGKSSKCPDGHATTKGEGTICPGRRVPLCAGTPRQRGALQSTACSRSSYCASGGSPLSTSVIVLQTGQ